MRILIGSSSALSIHAVVASTAAEKASWLPGISLVPAVPGGVTLSTDADLLGSGTVQLESISLVAVSFGAEPCWASPQVPLATGRSSRLACRSLLGKLQAFYTLIWSCRA